VPLSKLINKARDTKTTIPVQRKQESEDDDEDDMPLHQLANKQKEIKLNEKRGKFFELSNRLSHNSMAPTTRLQGIYDFLKSDSFLLTMRQLSVCEKLRNDECTEFSFIDEEFGSDNDDKIESNVTRNPPKSPIIELIKPTNGEALTFSTKNLKRKLNY
jgi:hypothetical protein